MRHKTRTQWACAQLNSRVFTPAFYRKGDELDPSAKDNTFSGKHALDVAFCDRPADRTVVEAVGGRPNGWRGEGHYGYSSAQCVKKESRRQAD